MHVSFYYESSNSFHRNSKQGFYEVSVTKKFDDIFLVKEETIFPLTLGAKIVELYEFIISTAFL